MSDHTSNIGCQRLGSKDEEGWYVLCGFCFWCSITKIIGFLAMLHGNIILSMFISYKLAPRIKLYLLMINLQITLSKLMCGSLVILLFHMVVVH